MRIKGLSCLLRCCEDEVHARAVDSSLLPCSFRASRLISALRPGFACQLSLAKSRPILPSHKPAAQARRCHCHALHQVFLERTPFSDSTLSCHELSLAALLPHAFAQAHSCSFALRAVSQVARVAAVPTPPMWPLGAFAFGSLLRFAFAKSGASTSGAFSHNFSLANSTRRCSFHEERERLHMQNGSLTSRIALAALFVPRSLRCTTHTSRLDKQTPSRNTNSNKSLEEECPARPLMLHNRDTGSAQTCLPPCCTPQGRSFAEVDAINHRPRNSPT